MGLFSIGTALEAVKAVGSGAGKLADAWGAQQKRLTDEHGIDKTTAKDMVIAGYQADLSRGLQLDSLNATQAIADRQSRWTKWIRPTFCAIAAWYVGCAVLVHTMPGVAAWLGIEVTPLPFPLDWIVPGIPVAVLGLRPLEKNGQTNLAAQAHANAATNAPVVGKRPALRVVAGTMRRDDAM